MMNRYLFLGTLQKELEKSLNESEVKNIIEYYDNYILEALDYGKTEKEIIDELGNPVTLSQEIVENLKKEEGLETSDWQDVVNQVGKEIEKTVQVINENVKEVINEFNRYEENEGSKEFESFDQQKTFTLDMFSHLDINMKDLPCHVRIVEDEILKLTLVKKEADASSLFTRIEHNTLYVGEKKSPVYSFFKLGSRKLLIDIPKTYKGTLKLTCDNSKIVFEGNKQRLASDINLHCDNGYVQIEEAVLGRVHIACGNGKVKLNDVVVFLADIECKNGMISYYMSPNGYSKKIELSCRNGYISVDGLRSVNGRLNTVIPSKNDSNHMLSLIANCDNGMIKLKGFD